MDFLSNNSMTFTKHEGQIYLLYKNGFMKNVANINMNQISEFGLL